MEFGLILLQAGASLPAVDPATILETTKDGGFAALISKTLTDIGKAAWGGKRERHPPQWVPLVMAVLFGVIGVMIAFAMRGVPIFDPQWIAASLGLGLTSATPGAIATTVVHENARPHPEPIAPPTPAAIPPVVHAVPPPPPPSYPDPGVAIAGSYQPPAEPAESVPQQVPDYRALVMDAAAHGFNRIPYRLEPPPDGVTTLDCSLYVLKVYEAAGLPFGPIVRTAEQIRQACVAIHHTEALPGDLVFFERTYDARGPAGPDGLIASHIGISLGAGSLQMYDHNDARGVAGITNIATDYWQGRFIDVRRYPHLVEPPAFAPAAPTTLAVDLVHAIDVASYQPTDLSDLVHRLGAQHVVVKLYQTVERIGNRTVAADHSRAQIASALANGCSVGGYIWGYAERDPVQSVRDGMQLSRSCGVELPILWLDIEPYPSDNSVPGAAWIRAALAECAAQGGRGGIYSGRYVWDRLGHPQFPGVPLWTADYNNRADLDVPGYGEMRVVGHQYTSTPVDRNVFSPEAHS